MSQTSQVLGILPQIVKQIVDRRVYIKQLLKRFPMNHQKQMIVNKEQIR